MLVSQVRKNLLISTHLYDPHIPKLKEAKTLNFSLSLKFSIATVLVMPSSSQKGLSR